jgi:hypothetical protein
MTQNIKIDPTRTRWSFAPKIQNPFSVLFFGVFLIFSSSIAAKVVDLGHLAIEDANISVHLSTENSGHLMARCKDCGSDAPEIRLTIDQSSEVYLNHKRSSFEQIIGIDQALKAVIYEPNSMRLFKLNIVTDF